MLRTERLLIRSARESDAKDLFAVYGDAETMRFWSSLPDKDVSDTSARLREMCDAPAPHTYFVFEMDGTAIGAGGVHQDSEVGFILNRSFWRRGIVSEAMTALTPWLFETLQAQCLTADVDPRNQASLACLAALGFTETSRAKNTFCIDGQWSDSVYLALQRPS